MVLIAVSQGKENLGQIHLEMPFSPLPFLFDMNWGTVYISALESLGFTEHTLDQRNFFYLFFFFFFFFVKAGFLTFF